MSGGGGQNVTQSAVTKPWASAENMSKWVVQAPEKPDDKYGYTWDWLQSRLPYEQNGNWDWDQFTYPNERIAGFDANQVTAMDEIAALAQNNELWGAPIYETLMNQHLLGGDPMGVAGAEMADTWDANKNMTLDTLRNQHLLGGNTLDNSGEQLAYAWDKAIKPTISGDMLNPQSNPYLQQYAQAAVDPIQKNFTNNIMPSLRSTAQMSGRSSGGAESDLITNAMQQNEMDQSNALANIYAPAYENERNRQMTAANIPVDFFGQQQQTALNAMNPLSNLYGQSADMFTTQQNTMLNALPQYENLTNLAFDVFGKQAAVGEEKQRLEQAKIDSGMQKFNEQIYNPYNFLSSVGNLAFSGGNVGGVNTSTANGYAPGLAQSLLGGGLNLTSLLGQLGVFK